MFEHCVPLCVYMQAQEACGPLEIDNALSMVRDLEKDIKEAKASAEEGKLKPLPGETVRKAHTAIYIEDEQTNSSPLTANKQC